MMKRLVPTLTALCLLAAGALWIAPAEPRRLRVCADPNNLPFSNQQEQGFENRLAELLARELDATLEYTWWAQRRGFIRNTLRAGSCDVVMGIPSSFELALPTRPYYRSTYVFVTRSADSIDIASLDDPLLRRLRIGVHLAGDDYANTPPAHALTKRGIIQNVRGYTLYGDYSEPDPPTRILDALVRGEIDVAIVWGPFAGYYERKRGGIAFSAVTPQIDLPFLPMVFDIAMGVRREDTVLRDEIDAILARRQEEVDRILDVYGVPRPTRARFGGT